MSCYLLAPYIAVEAIQTLAGGDRELMRMRFINRTISNGQTSGKTPLVDVASLMSRRALIALLGASHDSRP